MVALAEMVDVALIELERLLGCSVDELVALVKPMSADSCEQYARAILSRLGGPSFEQLMMRIIQTAAAKGVSPPPSDPDTYYFAARELRYERRAASRRRMALGNLAELGRLPIFK